MDRILKLFLIVIVLSALSSCGIFFTPMEGRWNPADPKSELQTFNPTIDGYAHNVTLPALTWEGSLTQMIAWKDSKNILLRFNTDDFPRVVAASSLRLWVIATPSVNTQLSIYRIKSDWEPDPDDPEFYNTVNNADAFYDDSRVTNFIVAASPPVGEYIEIPLGEVFSGKKDDLANGIVIFSDVAEALTFHTTESGVGGTAPLLLVEPE
jgi:hypothetical protein